LLVLKRPPDIDDVLRAAGITVSGSAVLPEGLAVQPGWLVVERADGSRVRIDGVPAGQQAAAVAIVLTLDLSDAAIEERWEARNPERLTLRQEAAQAIADIDAGIADIDAYLLIADAATAAQVRTQVKRLSQLLKGLGRIDKRVIARLVQLD
jgi:hypothetical protein